MNIRDQIFVYKATIRQRKGDAIIVVALLLAATLGLGVGYLLGKNTAHAPIIIEQCAER